MEIEKMKDSDLIEKLLKGFDQITVAATCEDAYDIACEMLELEPKPRTKTEYERVDLVESWEYFKLMSDEGDLYVNCTGLSYEGMLGDNINLANALHDGSCIYRKVEIEIDERQEFIDTSVELLNQNSHDNEANHYKEWFGAMFDSGKFKLVE